MWGMLITWDGHWIAGLRLGETWKNVDLFEAFIVTLKDEPPSELKLYIWPTRVT